MGNQESCCYKIDEKKGEIQSNNNSLKYSSIIYNTSNRNNKSHMNNAKSAFTNDRLQENHIQVPESKISVKSSKTSNQQQQNNHYNFHPSQSQGSFRLSQEKPGKSSLSQNPISEKSSSFHEQKIHSFNIQNPGKPELTKRNQINQQTLDFLKTSNASEQKLQNDFIHEKRSNSYRHSEIDNMSERNQKSSTRTHKKAVQAQITMEYLPIVKKLIERERPFGTELQQIPKSKIKTRQVNNGQDIYKGQLNYYQRPHGYGVLAKKNGNVLIGKFENGSINGNAFYIFSNGSYYEGYMTDNKANDDMGEFHSLAMSYTGGFKDNLFHGEGKQIGEYYYFQGVYSNHLKKKGILKWNSKLSQRSNRPNQQKKYYDKFHIQVILPEARKSLNLSEYDFEYQGDLDSKQKFTGKGRLKDPNGEYVGEFNQGKKHGEGTYLFENKLKYVGQYKDNKKQGYGKLYNCDGTMAYEGFWKNNLPDGKGYSYGLQNKPVLHQFIQGISTLLAPEAK